MTGSTLLTLSGISAFSSSPSFLGLEGTRPPSLRSFIFISASERLVENLRLGGNFWFLEFDGAAPEMSVKEDIEGKDGGEGEEDLAGEGVCICWG